MYGSACLCGLRRNGVISTAGSHSTDTGTLMNDKTVGLILKEQDYRESSVILTVLTEEYGKISLVAQSARKMTSKNRGSILPYTKGEFFFDFKETRTMFRLKTAHTIEMYRYLHEDLNASLAIAVIAEVMDAFLLESADFEAVCRGHRQRFEHYADFLDRNGVPHIFTPDAPDPAPFDEAMKKLPLGGYVRRGCIPIGEALGYRLRFYAPRLLKKAGLKIEIAESGKS